MNKDIAILEIRAAAGGDEAKLWAKDLMRMYLKYAASQNWQTDRIDELTLRIKGPEVFSQLEHESGVHRVQRIPVTEKRGRIHTSTATVAVLPQVPQAEINLKNSDLEWQFYRASTQGGQNVQKVSTAVRLKHKPSGLIVTSEEERYQERNRELALELLKAKLWEQQERKKEKEIAGYRSPIGRGMRSEKIRTYNYPRNQIKDHRLKKSFGNLDKILAGDLEKIIKLLKKI